ncbi:LysM domain-containing protein, partial [Kamptonema cortianum]|nr:LysM domain-containing protein [Kamptonema cortianum]
ISSIGKLNYTYEVRKGDSLSKIAQNHNISVESLIAVNQNTYPSLVTNRNLIEVGWRFFIPTCR